MSSFSLTSHPQRCRLDSPRSLAWPRALPPAPMAATTSYGPIRVPVSKAIGTLRGRFGWAGCSPLRADDSRRRWITPREARRPDRRAWRGAQASKRRWRPRWRQRRWRGRGHQLTDPRIRQSGPGEPIDQICARRSGDDAGRDRREHVHQHEPYERSRGGVVAASVALRTRELGVRLAVGCS